MIKAYLGIELGSTRIRAVVINEAHAVIAQGSSAWEDKLENGVWTYPLEEVWSGLRAAVGAALRALRGPVSIAGIGISGMMHGYMPFDQEGRPLTAFRTWRNTFTGKASMELSAMFGRSVPQRWSVAHLYHAVMAGEPHVNQIRRICTLAGYVHHRLTGEFVTGIGDASGMFPLDGDRYCMRCMAQFSEILADFHLSWQLDGILPEIRKAGEYAGVLTEDGARLLDSTGKLKAGIPMAPPEGSAATGMVSTNSIAPTTGIVSAGVSIYSMTVLEKPLSRPYPEIDIVATPTGKPVAMVHCNNCTADISAWAKTYQEFSGLVGAAMDEDSLYAMLLHQSVGGDPDCGGVTVVGYLAGEHVTDFASGCPLVLRGNASRFTLANFLRAQVYSAFASLAIGMRILRRENVSISRITAHGGFFKTPEVGQQYLADAVNAPVAVMEIAVDSVAYGMALLTAFLVQKGAGETLENYLDQRVFGEVRRAVIAPCEEGVKGFQAYLQRFERALLVERAAVNGKFSQ